MEWNFTVTPVDIIAFAVLIAAWMAYNWIFSKDQYERGFFDGYATGVLRERQRQNYGQAEGETADGETAEDEEEQA